MIGLCLKFYNRNGMKNKYDYFLFFYLLPLLFCACQAEENKNYTDWEMYSGDHAGTRFSALSQINKHNVKHLKPIWTYRMDDASKSSTIQCNPIVTDWNSSPLIICDF